MRRTVWIAAAAFGVALGAASAVAEQARGEMSGHMAPPGPDNRHVVDVPAHMRERMLANMRAQHEAVSEVMAALAAGDGAKAGKIADERLGVSSMGAAACKPGAASGAMGDMAAMMAKHMPDDMRAMGMTMHESASKFAETAKKIATGGDVKPALADLVAVMQNCAACHSAFRLK